MSVAGSARRRVVGMAGCGIRSLVHCSQNDGSGSQADDAGCNGCSRIVLLFPAAVVTMRFMRMVMPPAAVMVAPSVARAGLGNGDSGQKQGSGEDRCNDLFGKLAARFHYSDPCQIISLADLIR